MFAQTATIVAVEKQRVLYRLSQEERTIVWEVILSIILSKKLYTNICPIPNGFRDRAILVVWLGRPVFSFPPPCCGREGQYSGRS
jgi:hypothetical protein